MMGWDDLPLSGSQRCTVASLKARGVAFIDLSWVRAESDPLAVLQLRNLATALHHFGSACEESYGEGIAQKFVALDRLLAHAAEWDDEEVTVGEDGDAPYVLVAVVLERTKGRLVVQKRDDFLAAARRYEGTA